MDRKISIKMSNTIVQGDLLNCRWPWILNAKYQTPRQYTVIETIPNKVLFDQEVLKSKILVSQISLITSHV